MNTKEKDRINVKFQEPEAAYQGEDIRVSEECRTSELLSELVPRVSVPEMESSAQMSASSNARSSKRSEDPKCDQGESKPSKTIAAASLKQPLIAPVLCLIIMFSLICIKAQSISEFRESIRLRMIAIKLENELALSGLSTAPQAESKRLSLQKSLATYYYLLHDFEKSLTYSRNVVALIEQDRRSSWSSPQTGRSQSNPLQETAQLLDKTTVAPDKTTAAPDKTTVALENAHLRWGQCLYKLGRFKEALSEFELATRNNRRANDLELSEMIRNCRTIEGRTNVTFQTRTSGEREKKWLN